MAVMHFAVRSQGAKGIKHHSSTLLCSHYVLGTCLQGRKPSEEKLRTPNFEDTLITSEAEINIVCLSFDHH